MAKLSEFGKITQKFANLVDFAIVYVEEAHPIDGWKFKVRFTITKFKSNFVLGVSN